MGDTQQPSGAQLTRLQESLLALSGIKNQLEPALRAIKRHRQDDDVKAAIASQLVILTVSFLEEWKNLERLGKDERIRQTLRVTKPAVDRVRKWADLSRYRSSMLAHGFRGTDGRLFNPTALAASGRAPFTFAEQMLLAECAVLAIATAYVRHAQEHQMAFVALAELWPGGDVEPEGITTMAEFESEIARIRVAITAADSGLDAAFRGEP